MFLMSFLFYLCSKAAFGIEEEGGIVNQIQKQPLKFGNDKKLGNLK